MMEKKVRVTVSADLDIDPGWNPSFRDAAIAIYEAGENPEVHIKEVEDVQEAK